MNPFWMIYGYDNPNPDLPRSIVTVLNLADLLEEVRMSPYDHIRIYYIARPY